MDENNKDNNNNNNGAGVTGGTVTDTSSANDEVKDVEVINIASVATDPTPVAEVTTEPVVENTPVSTVDTLVSDLIADKKRNVLVQYGLMALGVVVIGLGLLFILEKEGRVSTSVFTPIIENLRAKEAVAKVNGVEIVRGDYENSLRQLTSMYEAQGMDISTEESKKSLAEESLETLINGEILRQEAVKAGMTASQEKIDERYKEIETSIGGAVALAERMKEFSVSKESLLRDIENEILIQSLFDASVIKDTVVTEEEIKKFYNDATGPDTDLPPLAEVKDQIEASLKGQKEQEQVATFLKEAKDKATIEKLI